MKRNCSDEIIICSFPCIWCKCACAQYHRCQLPKRHVLWSCIMDLPLRMDIWFNDLFVEKKPIATCVSENHRFRIDNDILFTCSLFLELIRELIVFNLIFDFFFCFFFVRKVQLNRFHWNSKKLSHWFRRIDSHTIWSFLILSTAIKRSLINFFFVAHF